MTEEGKTKGIAFPGDHQPSAPPQPHPAYYYGTFQGVANHQPPYPPPPPTYQPSVGFPQPSPPANIHNHIHHPYYPHGYQTVPGIVVASGTPVIIEQAALPCCGFGIGWVLFIVGFVFGAIPWYIGAFILLCVRTDRREKAGLVACTIAAVLAVLALGCKSIGKLWEKDIEKMKKEDTVKLISAEGFEFVIDKNAAMVSQTIRNMLTSPGDFAETEHQEVTFPEISTTILEKICQYFYWSLQYASGKETEFHIEPELTLELMMAANYLHT